MADRSSRPGVEVGAATLQAAIIVPVLLSIALFGFSTLLARKSSSEAATVAADQAVAAAVETKDLASARFAAVAAVDQINQSNRHLRCSLDRLSGLVEPGEFVTARVSCTQSSAITSPLLKPATSSAVAVEVVDVFRGSDNG